MLTPVCLFIASPSQLQILSLLSSGKCVAKKLDPGEKAMPFIVELVMIDNEDSKVACHSTLFREISDIYSIPDEMEYEVCSGTCSGYEDIGNCRHNLKCS